MQMISSDYKMTFGYGSTTPPYGTAAYPYHRGDDWYMPDGTPIVVNGVQIGLSGHTGFVTGPHCHVGKWIGDQDCNPESQGWALDNPVVTQVGNDPTNGYWVKLRDSAGVTWVYLHMTPNSQSVSVGQVLADLPKYKQQGADVMDQNDGTEVYRACLHREPESAEAAAHWDGLKFSDIANTDIRNGAEWQAQDAKLKAYDGLVTQIASLQQQVNGTESAQILADLQTIIKKYSA